MCNNQCDLCDVEYLAGIYTNVLANTGFQQLEDI